MVIPGRGRGLLAEPVIGPATSGRTRWLGPAMTTGCPRINLLGPRFRVASARTSGVSTYI
jgi:hypothetical protein